MLANDRVELVTCTACYGMFDRLITDGRCPYCRVTQLEAVIERLRARLWWTQTAPPLRAEEIPVDVVEKYRQFLTNIGGDDAR